MAEQANVGHVSMKGLHEVVLDSVSEHVEGLSPGKVAHDVETVKVEPIRDIYGLILPLCELLHKLICVVLNSRFIVA